MRKLVFIVLCLMLAVPAYALLDNENTNSSSSSSAASSYAQQQQGQAQGQGQGQGQIAAQGQGQLGIVSPEQSSSLSVGGDTQKNVAYVMTAPNTVAGQGQQGSSIYSIFGGVNMAQTAEYQICKEKIDVASIMAKNGYLTPEEAKAEALEAYKQLKDNTQEKRILWIGPKTRGVHLGNLCGLLAMDACNEINSDNWFGTKDMLTGAGEFLTSPMK